MGDAVAKPGPDSGRGREKRMNSTDIGLYFPFIVGMSLPKIEAQGDSVLLKEVLDFQADQGQSRI